ncbi:YhhA family cyclophane-containing RiPP [Novosphingobium sp. B1]|uniref:YhhA family cyclophane-containing RiPP n=1 Tax=Novosphingobium sp. B1 TaxID=1938756 RepID=UPI0034CD02E9
MSGLSGTRVMQVEKRASVATDIVLSSTALTRVIAEVRAGAPQPVMAAYNRTYNRHNR